LNWNFLEPELYECALKDGEAQVTSGGALCAETGAHTGRSPKDKYIVCDDQTEQTIWWENNGKMTPAQFARLYQDFIAHSAGKTFLPERRLGHARDVDDHRFAVARRPMWASPGVARRHKAPESASEYTCLQRFRHLRLGNPYFRQPAGSSRPFQGPRRRRFGLLYVLHFGLRDVLPETNASTTGRTLPSRIDQLDPGILQRRNQFHQRIDVAADNSVACFHALNGRD
jgi:hypothetical protein